MTAPLDRWKAAVERGDSASVRALFTQHPELTAHVNAQIFAFDSSAIFYCRNNIEFVDLLLEHGADRNRKFGLGPWWFRYIGGRGS